MKKCLPRIFCLAVCLMMTVLFAVPCFAADSARRTVRVGYFDLGDYYRTDGDTLDSYDSAYLEKISEYSNLDFTYVDCGTWAEALTMLQNHEIDLVGTMQWNADREDKYEFCLQHYGYTIAEFAALPDSGYVYEDYDAIGGAVIGCTEDYVRRPEMDALFAAHHIAPTIKTYATQEQLEKALVAGEIDIIAANSHTMRSGWKVLERFSYVPYYFASWKGNTKLTDAIDEAQTKMSLYERSFVNEQVRKYLSGLLQVPLTKAEVDCIAEQNTYTICFDANTKPLVWKNADGGMQGTIIDLCGLIEEKTGLHFEFEPKTDAAAETAGSTDYADYHTFSDYTEDGPKNGSASAGFTDAILEDDFSIYYRVGTEYDPNGNYSIAVPRNRSGAQEYLQAYYPEYEIIEYDTPKDCLAAVAAGKTNLAFLCNSVAEATIVENNLQNVAVLRSTTMKMGIGLQFYGDDAPLLADIVDKGISQITEEEIKEIQLRYALEIKPDITLGYLVSQHIGVAVCVVIVLVAVVSLIGGLIVRNRVVLRENGKIEAANSAKTDFFSQMSHDMRTPMNGILGIANLSKDETDPEVLRENIGKIETSGRYLLSIINDTLDLQRIESGKLTLEPSIVNCREVIESATAMVRPGIAEKHIDFQVRNNGVLLDSTVRIDQVRMKQIFVNLISNAIKFTPEGGTITFEFACLGRDDKIAHDRFRIRDTGVGMSEDFIKNKLFVPFAQEHNSATEKYAGSGLGLSIVKKLVALMGGRIEVESELGTGTTFTVYLDIEKVDRAEAAENTTRETEERNQAMEKLHGCKILLAEDHPLNAEIATKLLEKAGCTVTWAKNGRECVSLLEKSPDAFDVILMDVRMPVMDGLEATKAIRLLPDTVARTIPIIAMTANAYSDDVAQCLAAGMDAHIAKPIEPAVMYQAIAQYIVH